MANPVKTSWKTEWFPIALILLSVALSLISFPYLPDKVITHWNFQGVADGWSPKMFHAVFFPLLFAGMYLMFLFLPYLDPRKERYAEFSKTYHIFKNLIILVLFLVFTIATLVNLGWAINVGITVGGLIGLLMIVLGNYLGKIKPNWFMGIRTPWTLSSENVWVKTHRVSGWLFILLGLSFMIAPFLPELFGLIIIFGGVLLLVVGTFLYSYIIFLKEKK